MSADLLKIVGDYADQVAAAERQAERHSMDAARAMDALYESGEWVAEWLEQKPAPKRPTNLWNPANRNRFIAWQAWKLEQQGRQPLHRTRSWQLLEAQAICKICDQVTDLAPGARRWKMRPGPRLPRRRFIAGEARSFVSGSDPPRTPDPAGIASEGRSCPF